MRKSFDTIVELHKHIFQSMGIDNEMVLQGDTSPDLIYGGSGHIMGTTIMGTNPKESVVDQDCRSHDLSNLYILGSSVFSTSSTANPTSTIAALALRAASTIGKRLRLGERI